MTGLVVATEMEALPILRKLGGVKVASSPFVCFEISVSGSPPHVLAICGMGKKAAADATEHLVSARGAKEIINVGICGSLKGDLDVGELVWVRGAVDGDAILAGQTAPEIPSRQDPVTAGMNIASVDQPVFDDARRETLAAHADLVDMEAFGVAQTCQRLGVPFALLKGVSDQADGDGRESLQANIREVSEMLAETLAEMFLPMTKACSMSSRPSVVVVGEKAGEPAKDAPATAAPPPTGSDDPSTAKKILRFTKIEHTLFSLPLLFAGAWLGAGRRFPAWQVLAWIMLAGVGARTLGMAMNRIFDRRLDALNPRTAGRELPAGRMSLAGAIGVAAGGLAMYLLACWGLGPICLMLSPVPAVPLIGYSLLKRFTVLCHFGIGLCLAIAPLAAFIAASGGVHFDLPVLLLAGFTFCWMSGFDIVYAMQDIEPDRLAGVHSIPAAIGARGAEAVALATHAVALAAMGWMWQVLGGGVLPGIAAAVAVAAFVVGHLPQVSLARRFFPTSAIASIAAAMIVLLG